MSLIQHAQNKGESIRINGKKHTVVDDAYAQDARAIKTTLQQLATARQNDAPGIQLAAAVSQTLHGFLTLTSKKDPKTGRDTPNVVTAMPTKVDDKVKAALNNAFATAFKQNLPELKADSDTAKLVKTLGQQVFARASKSDKAQLDKMLTDLITQYNTQLRQKNAQTAKGGYNEADVAAVSKVLSPLAGEVPTGHQPTNDFLVGLQKLVSPDGKTVKPVTFGQVSPMASAVGKKYTSAQGNGHLSKFAALDASKKADVDKALDVLLKNTDPAEAQKIKTNLAKPIFGYSSP